MTPRALLLRQKPTKNHKKNGPHRTKTCLKTMGKGTRAHFEKPKESLLIHDSKITLYTTEKPLTTVHELEQAPLFSLITTYLSYLLLILFGHLRDIFGKVFRKADYKHLAVSDVKLGLKRAESVHLGLGEELGVVLKELERVCRGDVWGDF